uniref:Uncharacterized protein n=1 Tax=Meloidogyne enterolobii TaxID=390850 RepID=A0A6V7VE48_MELEN|nr:unnamed protein product [Meloidogyne enterolobii]
MSISLKNSDNDLTTFNNSINSLNDDKSMTDDSVNDCCIIEDNKEVEEEVKKIMTDILQNKIFDDGSPTQDEILKILRNRFNPYQLNASKATRYVNEMFGKTVLTEDEARNLFKRFSDGKTNRVNHELLEKRFKENPKISAAELAIGICSKSSAMRWLAKKNEDVESNKEKDKTPYSNKLRKRNAGQMADNVSKEKQIPRKGHTADKERTDGQHSICQIDPVTKKRFYEPHKRPDCDDIYCLSSVTQIGERICNIENKMIELEELFCALVKKNTSENNKITNNNHHQQQPSSFFSQQQFLQQQNIRQFAPTNNFNGTRAILGCSLRNILPIQGRNEQIYRPNTSSQVQQRIIAPTQPFAVNTRPPPRLPIASATATISTTRPLEGYPMPRQLNIIRPQINENSSYKPLDIPHKELKNGVRVFFMDTSSQNTCPVCFGAFPGIIFTDRSASIIQNVHLKRHTSGPLEAFYCQICSHCVTQPRVLFLSLPSIVQHLINSHGMPKNVKHDSFYIRNFNNSETTEALQHFIANQLKLSITQLITEMNSSNLNWAKTVPVGQFVKSSNPPANTKNKQKVDNTKNNQQNKKKKKRGREETPPFDLNGDPLDQLLKCPSQCTLIQRHRTHLKRKQVPVKQILEPIKMQNVIIDLSLIGLAKYIDYKNDKGQIRSDKQNRKEGNEGGSNPLTLDDNEDKTDESEDNEDEEISSNDSDYSPRKANRGFETRKRKKMESSERCSSTNIVDQLQQHRLQQIIEKNLNNTPSSSQSLPANKGLMNFTLNSPLSSNGVQNVVCKTEPANQQH